VIPIGVIEHEPLTILDVIRHSGIAKRAEEISAQLDYLPG
jgi:hypothetical protein